MERDARRKERTWEGKKSVGGKLYTVKIVAISENKDMA